MSAGCSMHARPPEPAPKAVSDLFWYRSTEVRDVAGHPDRRGRGGPAAVPRAAVPRRQWGYPDERVLPKSASAHQVGDQLRSNFADNSGDRRHRGDPRCRRADPADFDRYATGLSTTPDVPVDGSHGYLRRGPQGRSGPGVGRNRRWQCLSDDRQQRRAVLRCLRHPVGQTACRTRARWPAMSTSPAWRR